MTTIKASLMKDRYWASIIHLFQNNWKLKQVFTTKYFDLDDEIVHIQALKKKAAPGLLLKKSC